MAPGATLKLLRDGVLENTLVNVSGGTPTISDRGLLIPDGIYQYTLQQVDIVGNSGVSAAVTVHIVTSAAAPAPPVLQAGSDTGTLGDHITSSRNPVFNVSGVPDGATLSLVRNGVVVNTLPSVSVGGTVAIGDPGPVADGTYSYTAFLIDGAGNLSLTSAPWR